MRTVYYEQEMLKTRRSEIMQEYKNIQPKQLKIPQKVRQINSFQIRWLSLLSILIQTFQYNKDKTELKPSDS
jgi:hypothetical protein